MSLHTFAREVLFGTTLEAKLQSPPSDFALGYEALTQNQVPDRPGRPRSMRFGSASFPKAARFHEPTTRGRVLHFFANHELLALELMALALLRFPDAPPAFLQGVLRTLTEEQRHMRLYIERMRRLGVDFGDLPTSAYFWQHLRSMQSPLDYTVQMSLTLEQANLDYAKHYRDVMREHDPTTATLLDQVYEDEIAHVKHGATWFQRLRPHPDSNSWQAYCDLLPYPLTPRRARGIGFDREARKRAGLEPTFIDALEMCHASRGRIPHLWRFDVNTEHAWSPTPASLKKDVKRLAANLDHLAMFIAQPEDLVWCPRPPPIEWLRTWVPFGFAPPTFVSTRENVPPNVSTTHAWGLCPEHQRWRASFDLDSEPIDPCLFRKDFWVQELNIQHACVVHSWEEARDILQPQLNAGLTWVAKAPLGMSGRGARRFFNVRDLAGKHGTWTRQVLQEHGAVVLQPWRDRVADLSVQMQITTERPQILGTRSFVTTPQGTYRGSWLGSRGPQLSGPVHRFLSTPQWRGRSGFAVLQDMALRCAEILRERGYRGPAGMDAMVWKGPEGLVLTPFLELNARHTMGRVALELERFLQPGIRGFFAMISRARAHALGFPSLQELARAWEARFPPTPSSRFPKRLATGILWTSPPQHCDAMLTGLFAGDAVKVLALKNADSAVLRPRASA